MNAILQCFIHTPLIQSYFTSGLFKNNISRNVERVRGKILADLVGSFSREYTALDDPIYSLRRLRVDVGKHLSQFQGYDQHDAQEFLAMFIDKLTEELTVSVASMAKTAPPGFFNAGSPAKLPEVKSDEKKVSVMGDLFSGKLCTKVTCPHCGHMYEKEDGFCYLSLPLPQEVLAPTNYRTHTSRWCALRGVRCTASRHPLSSSRSKFNAPPASQP